jgi:hypothetical protein
MLFLNLKANPILGHKSAHAFLNELSVKNKEYFLCIKISRLSFFSYKKGDKGLINQ